MTTRDPYTVEAARRIKLKEPSISRRIDYDEGKYDSHPVVVAHADTLKELGWQPPISLELQAAREAIAAAWPSSGWNMFPERVTACQDAIARYKKLAPAPRVDNAKHALRHAEEALDTMLGAGGYNPSHHFRGTLALVRDVLKEWEA